MKNLVFILIVVLVSIKALCVCFDCTKDTRVKIQNHYEAIEQASK